jgi:hypothetical protein
MESSKQHSIEFAAIQSKAFELFLIGEGLNDFDSIGMTQVIVRQEEFS